GLEEGGGGEGGFAFQAGQAVLEAEAGLAVFGRGDDAEAGGAAKLGQGAAGDAEGAVEIAGAMLVVHGELFIGFEALAGISEHGVPHLAGGGEIAFALGEARKRAASDAARGFGQLMLASDG